MTMLQIIPFDGTAGTEPLPEWPAEDIVSGTRQHSGKILFEDKSRGLSAGIWEQGANESRWLDYPVNEFMLVLEGEVVIVEESRTVAIRAGEAFILPKGLRCRWTQPGHVKKFFVIFDDASGIENQGPLRTIRIDPRVKLDPSDSPPASMLLTPVPTQHNHLCFEDATGQFTIGVWDTTGYTRKLIPFPRHELMHLVEGEVTMDDGAGAARRFRAGDTFFVPMGAPNSWRSEGYLRKIYAIFQPKG